MKKVYKYDKYGFTVKEAKLIHKFDLNIIYPSRFCCAVLANASGQETNLYFELGGNSIILHLIKYLQIKKFVKSKNIVELFAHLYVTEKDEKFLKKLPVNLLENKEAMNEFVSAMQDASGKEANLESIINKLNNITKRDNSLLQIWSY